MKMRWTQPRCLKTGSQSQPHVTHLRMARVPSTTGTHILQAPRGTHATRILGSIAASVPSAYAAGSPGPSSGSKSRSSSMSPRGQTPSEGTLSSTEWFFTESGQKNWIEAMELDTLTPEMPALLKEMGLRYDPDRLAAVLATKWPQVYGRALTVSALLGGWMANISKDAVLGQLEANQSLRARQLVQTLSRLGPSFVKIGQALSARPDLLPKTYLEALADLQDRLPSFPTEIARTVIEEELGAPVEEMFSSFSAEPVAAASLGQVYKAILRTTGEQVAVKVQRPSIGESIAVDMLLLRRLMAAVDKSALPALGISQPLVPLVDEFAGRLFAELDYVMEGHNAEKFQKLYGGMPRVRTPAIKWDYTSRRVITMEWIEGVKLTNKQAMEAAGLSVVDFVDVGIECTLRQLLEHGFFHADPHPGNLLATRSGDLVYLDFGMMSEAPQYARYAIMAHVVHLVNRDYDAMCKDYYTLQFMDPSVDTSPIAPALAAFFDDVLDQSVSSLNFKAIVDGLGEVLFQFPFRVPAYYALILRSLTVLEGLALQADPQYKLLARAYPYMARRLLTDPAPELRDSFEDLVLKDGEFRWSRLENLIREGSKSQDFDSSQLWLLAEWLLSPSASVVRESMVAEMARIIDASSAASIRSQIIQRTGSIAVAEQLVPQQPQEAEAMSRAALLMEMLNTRSAGNARALQASASNTQAALPAGGSTGANSPHLSSSTGTSSVGNSHNAADGLQGLLQFKGSGPFGTLTPQDVQQLASKAQTVLADTMPRARRLLEQPGARDLIQGLSGQLARRFAARTIKLLFGSQTLLGSSSSRTAGSKQPTPSS